MANEFTPEQLDTEWRRLADSGEPFAQKIEEAFQAKVAESEALLASLRN